MNGAPGSAWASALVGPDGVRTCLRGAPAHDDPAPLAADHQFDLASLTKVGTAVAALSLVGDGVLDPDAPVRERLAVGTGPQASRITLRHLLTHTAGLPAEHPGWRTRSGAALLDDVLAAPVTGVPGTRHRYSDVGFVAAGHLLELVTGLPLDEVVDRRVAGPLGASGLTFRPEPLRAVATETQPHRGAVRGEVHDELAHALGAPVGHAGLFGTLRDVVLLAAALASDGSGERGPVLGAQEVRLMTTPAVPADGYVQAVGLRLRDRTWMGDVDAAGHTGFTGTCFAVLPGTGRAAVLLTNRVHPTRVGADVASARRRVVAALGGARS